MQLQNNKYKPSGEFENKAITNFLLSSVLAFPLLGYMYTYASYYSFFIPLKFVMVFTPLIFGAILGVYISLVIIRLGKVRNIPLACLFFILGTCVVFYFHWIFYIELMYDIDSNNRLFIHRGGPIDWSNIATLLFSPSELISNIKEAFYTMIGGDNDGLGKNLALSCWLGEISLTMGMAIYTGIYQATEPFNESRNEWFDKKEFIRSYIVDTEQMINDIKNNVSTSFDNQFPTNDVKRSHSEFTLYESKSGENYLTIVNKEVKIKRGKTKEKEKTIVKYIGLSDELKRSIIHVS